MKHHFTISVFTENCVGLLVKVSGMFSRRRICIESLNVASSGIEGIHRFTILIKETEEVTRKLMLQIEKQVDVFKAFYNRNEDVVFQEQVLFKVSSTNYELETLLVTYEARCVLYHNQFKVFEVTGTTGKANAIITALQRLGISEMVKGGRIAVCTPNLKIHKKLRELAPLRN